MPIHKQYEIHFVIIQLDQLHFPLLFIFTWGIQGGLIEIYYKFESAYMRYERWNSTINNSVIIFKNINVHNIVASSELDAKIIIKIIIIFTREK